MLDIHLSQMPNVYGEGAIFAFSGIDGETNVASEFVTSFSANKYGLIFHTPTQRQLSIKLDENTTDTVLVATGDVLWVTSELGQLILTWSAWHTLVGEVPANATISLANEGDNPEPDQTTVIATSNRDVMVMIREHHRYAIAYGESTEVAMSRAKQGLTRDIRQIVASRLAWYEKNQHTVAEQYQHLANKCLSVMKVNTLTPEDTFQDYWSTPDRVPHRNLWLWDSVFHALAMTHVKPTLAWYFLKSVLDMQAENGMIPISGTPEGVRATIFTQPPLLAWGVWVNYQTTKNKTQLAYAFPRLSAYLQWNLDNRDRNGNHLLEWDIEEDELCRSGESGMDNSPRFDDALLLDAVDFSTFQAHDMFMLSEIANELGEDEQSVYWKTQATQMSQQIYAELWSSNDGLYIDKPVDNNITIDTVEASSGFLPLLLPDIPQEHVTKLVETLTDSTKFWSAFPVPSVSLDHPTWSTDMWRGSTWLNFNYLIMLGLQKQGQHEIANELRQKSIDMVHKYYEECGVLFEFYDATDEHEPFALGRKGAYQPPYDFRQKYHTIRDFHWTAATIFLILIDTEQK